MTTYRDAVQSVATTLGYGHHTRHIDAVSLLFENGASDARVIDTLVNYGVGRGAAIAAVDRVRAAVAQTAATTESEDGPAFDRDAACSVIRAFIQNGSQHVGQNGASEEDVTALLVIAGLLDAPEPEPTVETAEVPGLLARLASWARGQGFSG